MKQKRKILAALLSFMLIFSTLTPLALFAADDAAPDEASVLFEENPGAPSAADPEENEEEEADLEEDPEADPEENLEEDLEADLEEEPEAEITPAIVSLSSLAASVAETPTMTDEEAMAFHFSTLVMDTHVDILNRTTIQGTNVYLPMNRPFVYTGTSTTHAALVDVGKNISDLSVDVVYDSLNLNSSATNPTVSRFRMIDIPKMVQGGFNAVFYAAYTNASLLTSGNYNTFSSARANSRHLSMINTLYWNERRNADIFAIATSPAEVLELAETKSVAIPSIEGGDFMTPDNAIELLRQYYDLGIRLLLPLYSNNNHLGRGVSDSTLPISFLGLTPEQGLTQLGKDVMQEMFRLGIIPDVSHAHENTFWDMIAEAEEGAYPIIASHSSSKAVMNAARNLTDEQAIALARTGGVVQLAPTISFITPKPATQFMVSDFIDHLDHFVEILDEEFGEGEGVNYLGFGSDFDGGITLPADMQTGAEFYKMTLEMARRGYTEEQMAKILGGNVMRVMQTTESKAAPKVVAEEFTITPIFAQSEYGNYVGSQQPLLTAAVSGGVVNDYRVIIDGIVYDSSACAYENGVLSLQTPAPLASDVRDAFHVVTFEVTNASGAPARATCIFYVSSVMNITFAGQKDIDVFVRQDGKGDWLKLATADDGYSFSIDGLALPEGAMGTGNIFIKLEKNGESVYETSESWSASSASRVIDVDAVIANTYEVTVPAGFSGVSIKLEGAEEDLFIGFSAGSVMTFTEAPGVMGILTYAIGQTIFTKSFVFDGTDPFANITHVFDVAELKAAVGADQLLVSIRTGATLAACITYAFEKEGDFWVMKLAAPGNTGASGVSYTKREGDGATPAGVYELTTPFGRSPDPGSAIQPYLLVLNQEHYWVDETYSDYYNMLVTRSGLGKDSFNTDYVDQLSKEHLQGTNPSYNYAMMIEYNTRPVVAGYGSAIFMHRQSNNPGTTAGCINMADADIIFMLKFVKPGTNIVISKSLEDLDYLKAGAIFDTYQVNVPDVFTDKLANVTSVNVKYDGDEDYLYKGIPAGGVMTFTKNPFNEQGGLRRGILEYVCGGTVFPVVFAFDGSDPFAVPVAMLLSRSGANLNFEPYPVFDVSVLEAAVKSTTDKLLVTIPTGRSAGTQGSAITYAFEKKAGVWTLKVAALGNTGSGDVSYNKQEGDSFTPGGLYDLSRPFGILPNPDGGSIDGYVRVRMGEDYWVTDVNSPLYNTWVKRSEVGDAVIDGLASKVELAAGTSLTHYNYALVIEYNPEAIPGKGSGLFLSRQGSSAGAALRGGVNMNVTNMLFMLKFYEPGLQILIVDSLNDLENYLYIPMVSAETNTKRFTGIAETAKNSKVWELKFSVAETYANKEIRFVEHSIRINANNANIDGSYDLGDYTLFYDIKGNGSNIKRFEVKMK